MMNDDFSKELRKAKIYAIWSSVISLAAATFPIAAICLWAERSRAAIVFAILSVISIGIVWFLYKKEPSYKNRTSRLYRFSIHAESYDEIISAMEAERLSAEIAYCHTEMDKLHVRFLLKHITALASPKSLFEDARRAMKKHFPTSQRISIYDAAKIIRTEILVCDVNSENVAEWITKDFIHNMHRAESILRVCVVLEEQSCYVSMNVFGLELDKIKKYLYVVSLLKNKL